jgi:hypothetical protein
VGHALACCGYQTHLSIPTSRLCGVADIWLSTLPQSSGHSLIATSSLCWVLRRIFRGLSHEYSGQRPAFPLCKRPPIASISSSSVLLQPPGLANQTCADARCNTKGPASAALKGRKSESKVGASLANPSAPPFYQLLSVPLPDRERFQSAVSWRRHTHTFRELPPHTMDPHHKLQ